MERQSRGGHIARVSSAVIAIAIMAATSETFESIDTVLHFMATCTWRLKALIDMLVIYVSLSPRVCLDDTSLSFSSLLQP